MKKTLPTLILVGGLVFVPVGLGSPAQASPAIAAVQTAQPLPDGTSVAYASPGDTSVRISWEVPSEYADAVDNYDVRVQIGGQPERVLRTEDTSVLLLNIPAGTRVHAYLTAHGESFGTSDEYDGGTYTQPKAAEVAKIGAVTNAKLTRVSSRALQVSWTKPENSTGLRYRVALGEGSALTKTVGGSSVTFTGLPRGLAYRATITPVDVETGKRGPSRSTGTATLPASGATSPTPTSSPSPRPSATQSTPRPTASPSNTPSSSPTPTSTPTSMAPSATPSLDPVPSASPSSATMPTVESDGLSPASYGIIAAGGVFGALLGGLLLRRNLRKKSSE